jgi:hypothetical protein
LFAELGQRLEVPRLRLLRGSEPASLAGLPLGYRLAPRGLIETKIREYGLLTCVEISTQHALFEVYWRDFLLALTDDAEKILA